MRERATVIGEENSRKGKRGGGEALEAPGSTWCNPLPLHYTTTRRPLLPLSPLPFSWSLSASSLASYSPTYHLFQTRLTVRKGPPRRETPHDPSAKLKARHKPFYTPTRSTGQLSPSPYHFSSPGLSVLLLLSSLSLLLFLIPPLPSGLIPFLFPLLSPPPPPSLPSISRLCPSLETS